MRLLILFCQLFFISGIFAQSTKLSKEQAIQDLDFMISTVYETHPDMYAIIPEETFMKEVEKTKINLPDSLSPVDFYKYASPLLTLLGDGHTWMIPPEYIIAEDNKGFFPLSVYIDPADFSITDKDSQAKILRINGETSNDIVNNMLRYCSGELMPFRTMRASLMFPLLMRILYPAYEYNTTIIKNGIQSDTIIEGILAENIKRTFNNSQHPYSYRYTPDGQTAIMDFNSFKSPKNMRIFMDSMSLDLINKKVKNLIIDIRSNGGGDSSVGDELLQYISHVPFRQFGKTTVRISPLAKKNYDFSKEENGYKTYEEAPPIPLRENPLRLAGKMNIYLLTSSQSFSSATDFAWAFHYFGLGKIVGEETGGSIVSFGDVISDELPHSGLRFGVSFKKFYAYGVTEDIVRGVIPDFEVPADQALDYTLENLIGK